MKKRRIYPSVRGDAKPGRGLVVIVRGPMGSGKSTLLRQLKGRRPWRFWCVNSDEALSAHPGDPWGEFERTETTVDIDILALFAKVILGRGLSLLLEQNFQTTGQVDRFLRAIGRSRRHPRVLLLRLTVDTEEAVRRKPTVVPAYIRASHRGFHLHPFPEEVVIETTAKNARQVQRIVRAALAERFPQHGG